MVTHLPTRLTVLLINGKGFFFSGFTNQYKTEGDNGFLVRADALFVKDKSKLRDDNIIKYKLASIAYAYNLISLGDEIVERIDKFKGQVMTSYAKFCDEEKSKVRE